MQQLLDFLLSMRWIYIPILIMLWSIINRWLNIQHTKNVLKREELIKSLDYNEEKIISHLNYIITEEVDRYIAYNISLKNIYYINTKQEKELIAKLIDTIPDMLSVSLVEQLELIYSKDYIGAFIGQYIYATVTNYVLSFNTNNLDKNKLLSSTTDKPEPV